MSDTLEAPVVETTEAPVDRFAGVEFGSETQAERPITPTDQPLNTQTPPEPEGKTEPQEPTWYVKRIGSVTAKRKEAEERASRAEQELAEYKRALAASRGDEDQQPELTPDQIRQQERDVIARQQAHQAEVQQFGAATQRVAQSLTELHGAEAIQTATQSLVERAGLDFGNKSHQQIIRDISELPNSGAVYYALANDPDAASELLEAPERKQFAMLQRFADKMPAKVQEQTTTPPPRTAPAISKAPPPVAATSGSGRATSSRSIYDGDLSMEDYIKLRSKK
ncbi:hypothetical protein IGS75_01415 [Gluconobacter sphaericus]|uniref:hypothetical protein n=1 Tax=Gluconobacter sphaericus TaxID=574987 RepID=UPI001924D8D4|nr:hypothetical protein [Gluconobacter sphaericus]QQX91329.1 hypothetical protein IGS75_01415 [Gluconobacter sphaericus]